MTVFIILLFVCLVGLVVFLGARDNPDAKEVGRSFFFAALAALLIALALGKFTFITN